MTEEFSAASTSETVRQRSKTGLCLFLPKTDMVFGAAFEKVGLVGQIHRS
jgi:hypothetical protein